MALCALAWNWIDRRVLAPCPPILGEIGLGLALGLQLWLELGIRSWIMGWERGAEGRSSICVELGHGLATDLF